MGYTTKFTGVFKLNKQLDVETAARLHAIADYPDKKDHPKGAPDSYCQWRPTKLLDGLEWDGSEKFYDYEEWLGWLIEHELAPKGYTLTGEVKYRGEDSSDVGILRVVGNKVERIEATFDANPIDALREIVRRHGEGELEADDAAELARAALKRAEVKS